MINSIIKGIIKTIVKYIQFSAKALLLASILYAMYWGIWALSGQHTMFSIQSTAIYFIIFSFFAIAFYDFIENTY